MSYLTLSLVLGYAGYLVYSSASEFSLQKNYTTWNMEATQQAEQGHEVAAETLRLQ